jgi:hypothetical protein
MTVLTTAIVKTLGGLLTPPKPVFYCFDGHGDGV